MLAYANRIRVAPQVWISIAWLVLAMADATKTVDAMQEVGMHHNWVLLFTIDALTWLPWAVGSLLVIWLADRLRTLPRSSQWSVHLAIALAVGLAYSAWSAQLVAVFQPFAPEFTSWAAQWPSDFFDGLPATAVLYGCVLLTYNLIDSRSRLAAHETEMAQLNEQLVLAHQGALRVQPEPAPPLPERLAIKGIGGVSFINIAEIDWIAAEDYYSRLHIGGRSQLIRRSMTELERDLASANFRRIHRSTIVNLEQVSGLVLNESGEYDVRLRDGTTHRVSRSNRRALQMALDSRTHDGAPQR